MNKINGGIAAPKGFQAAGIRAGIKKSGKEDIALIYSEVPANAAAVFTMNAFAAAPVLLSRQAAEGGKISAIIANSGCANACTGDQGLKDAQAMLKTAAKALNVPAQQILVASTGVIGVPLPMDKVKAGIELAAKTLSPDGGDSAMLAIMTTDTLQKVCAYEFMLDGVSVRMGAMAKGAGMIQPNMATMLGFISTDAAVAPEVLHTALAEITERSFNMVTVDGDTSTNDMVSIMANGLAGNPLIQDTQSPAYATFYQVLETVCIELAKMIARDGEGATKFLEITVRGAKNFAEAKTGAKAVANSPLVKTAFFGQDPNWGRILCAIGFAGIAVEPAETSVSVGGIAIVRHGQAADYDNAALKAVMEAADIVVDIDLHLGQGQATVWTCDFSYEYVKINGEYHT